MDWAEGAATTTTSSWGNAVKLGGWAGCGFLQMDGGGLVVGGAVVVGSFDAVGVMSPAFDGSGIGAFSASGVEPSSDVAQRVGE